MSEVEQEDQSQEGVSILVNWHVSETIHNQYLHNVIVQPGQKIGDDYSDEEELEWNTFFAQPHVQAELERLAEEAERQFAAGDTEEGGFAVE